MGKTDADSARLPIVQLLSFAGCPLAPAAREALERAVRLSTLHGIRYEVIDILDPATPTGLARWGSPTILVDGEDVAEQSRGDGIGCRIYDTPAGVPSAETIAAAIRDRSGANRDRRG